jgi:hypothetical protein
MADKVVIEAEVKSNVGQVGKDAKSAAGEFKVMGVSLNSVKAGFVSAGTSAKAMFGSIKAGLMSTGIGAFVVLVGSLVTFFTNTKRGADQLSQAFTAMGAVVDVLTDRLSKVGEAIKFVFSGEFKKAGEALKGTFSGIADEVEREVKAMVALKKRTQELRDADNEFMVQKAKTRQEIEKARLIAEDETKSAAERLDNLRKALELEEKTTQRELVLARERMQIQKEEMALSENLAEDEAELARLQAEIIEKETASIKMRRRVVTEVNSLEREILAEEKARAKEKQDIIDAENKRIADAKAVKEKADKEAADKEIALAKEVAAEKKRIADEEKKEAERIADNKKQMNIDIANQGLQILGDAAGEGTAIAKGAAIAQATIAGTQSVINAFNSANANVGATAGTFGAYPITMASLAATFAAMNIAKIASGGKPSVSGGGGAGSVPQTPAPQMMSGAFELGGGLAPEPMKAFVVTDEMTSSQNQLANIRRTATI